MGSMGRGSWEKERGKEPPLAPKNVGVHWAPCAQGTSLDPIRQRQSGWLQIMESQDIPSWKEPSGSPSPTPSYTQHHPEIRPSTAQPRIKLGQKTQLHSEHNKAKQSGFDKTPLSG